MQIIGKVRRRCFITELKFQLHLAFEVIFICQRVHQSMDAGHSSSAYNNLFFFLKKYLIHATAGPACAMILWRNVLNHFKFK